MNRLKTYLLFGLIAVIALLATYSFIQKQKVEKLEHEMMIEKFGSYQEYIKDEFVPEALSNKTSDELTDMGGVLWGD